MLAEPPSHAAVRDTSHADCRALCSTVDMPHEDDGVTDDKGHFAATAGSPSGVVYDVQATPTSGVSGPVLLGTKNGVFERGPLGLLNRVLAKNPRSKQRNSFAVFVYGFDPDRTIVAESWHGSMPEARQAAQAFIQAISDGSFKGD